MTEHEKLPWSAINGGVDIVDNARCSLVASVWAQGENRAGPIAQANAAFIVKAVNNHDALVAALTELNAQVRGECPGLLNEDSGGDARLSMEIDRILADVGSSGERGK